jgi:hypothetical protein
MMFFNIGSTTPVILSFFFPSMFYIFSLKYLAGYELWQAAGGDQGGFLSEFTGGLSFLPMIIAALVSVFQTEPLYDLTVLCVVLYFCLAPSGHHLGTLAVPDFQPVKLQTLA